MGRLLILLMLAALPGFAQTPSKRAPQKKTAAPAAPAAVADKWPIVSLSVEGNRHYSRDQILAVAGLKAGQLAGKPQFDAARDRLVASGFFEMVAYKFDPAPNQPGEIGTFQVTEVDASYPARFEELGAPPAELETMLRAKDPLFSTASLPPTKQVLDRYVNWLQEYLDSKGSSEKLVARVNAVGPEKFEIVFRPARNLPAVAQVNFVGNHAISEQDLTEAIAAVAVGSPYTEEHFRELLNAQIKPRYDAIGHVRVAFPRVRTEPAKDVQGLHVIVTVDEGEAYQLSKVAVVGSTPLRPEDLLKTGKIPTGVVANFDQVGEGLERMRKALLHAGFMEAKVSADRSVDDAKKIVDLGIHVDPGPQFLMGKLTIAGLDLNGEFEIKRIWSIKEGKPFNADYPQAFLDSVREQGLFDNLGTTKPGTKINEQDHTVDVTLNFAGAGPPPKRERRGGFGQQ
jgi:outer membrane protein insertion porin family